MADQSAPPFPIPASPLVGREREQAALRAALDAALAGRGALVLIGGEAGIGKTALAEWALAEATVQGALALVGRCYDLADTPPYGPWAEALARAPRHDALPPSPDFAGGVGAASQVALFARVRGYLAALAARRPLVLLLDDLHWADPASLGLLRQLARSLGDLPLLLAGTYRPEEVGRADPFYTQLPNLVREADPRRLRLRPLAVGAVRALIETRYALATGDASRLLAYLGERAEGNPFFLGELLRALEEDELLRPDGPRWQLGDLAGVRVPALLRQVIDRRLARLGESAQQLLAVAAVIGQEVPLGLWSAVAGADEEMLLGAVEPALAAHLLVEATDGLGVRFAHALIRAALYEGTLPLRRRALHRRVAETLIAGPHPDPDAVAYHLRQAGDPRAGKWLVRAGERAQEAFAYETAVARFEEALPLLAADPLQGPLRAEALLRLARLLRQSAALRGVAYAREALDLARQAGDSALAAIAEFRVGADLCLAGRLREGLSALEAAAAAFAALPSAAQDRLDRLDRDGSNLELRWGHYALQLAITGRYAEAETYANAVLIANRRPPQAIASATNALTNAFPALGRVVAARAMFAMAQSHYRDTHEHFIVLQSCAYELDRLVIPYLVDQPGARAAVLEAGEAAYRRLTGSYAGLPRSAFRHGLDYLEGRWDEVAPLALGAFGLRQGNALVLARIALARGELGAAWDHLAGFIPVSPATEPGDAWYLGATAGQRLAAALALAADDLSVAREWLAAHDRWLAWAGAVLGQAEGQLGWAAYHRAAGNPAQARRHAEAALAHAGEPRQPLGLLAAHRALGEVALEAGHYTEATVHLDAALGLAGACAAPYERALTLVALAELTRRTGDPGQVGARLAEAGETLVRLRARPALARVEQLADRLQAAGVPPRTHPAGLTAREAEVLRLVASGLTDAEVAARLVRSRRTVHHHLRAIYAKIGVATRSAATRFAIEHGLA